MLVVYLMTSTSNFILGHISPFSLGIIEIKTTAQLRFKLSTILILSMIDDVKTSLHGFLEIEMDHIRFHLRSVDGFFSWTFMR